MSDIDNSQKAVAEPSLNEILSSIKKIIDDDLDGKEDSEMERIGIDELNDLSDEFEVAAEEDEEMPGLSQDDVLELTAVFEEQDLEQDLEQDDNKKTSEVEDVEQNPSTEPIKMEEDDALEAVANEATISNDQPDAGDVTIDPTDMAIDDDLMLEDDVIEEGPEVSIPIASKDVQQKESTIAEDSLTQSFSGKGEEESVDEGIFDLDDIGFFDVEDGQDESQQKNVEPQIPITQEQQQYTDAKVTTSAKNSEKIADDVLISDETNKLVGSTFKVLADTLLTHQGNKSRTIEDLVQEMLRPMMKQWLDTHLHKIVEKMVKEEIDRVTKVLR